MINLRYHVVSLVAVFLALAIGIFTGSTLLDRATVDYLKASRDRVDARNDELRATNEAWRQFGETDDRVEAGFAADVLVPLVAGRLDRRVVLTVATRGIDEPTVESMLAVLAAADATSLGVLWLDERTDLSDAATDASISAYLDAADPLAGEVDGSSTTSGPDADDVGSPRSAGPALLEHIATVLAPLPDSATSATTSSPQVAPTVLDPNAPTAPTPEAPVALRPNDDLLQTLVDADLADWSDPSGRLEAPPKLPDEELSVLVLAGEGAVIDVAVTIEPFVERLAGASARTVFGEVRRPRTSEQIVEGDAVPDRGVVVDGIRGNDDVVGKVATVDNVDHPAGMIAVVLVLAGPDGLTTGKYGEAPSAERPFPPSE